MDERDHKFVPRKEVEMLRMQDPDLEKLLAHLSEKDEFVFLDTSRPDPENIESLLFLDPVDRLVCRAGDNLEEYLERLQQRVNDGFFLAGWVGYEFGALLEADRVGRRRPLELGDTVIADLGVFLKPYRFDHNTGENTFPLRAGDRVLPDAAHISRLRPNMKKEEFIRALDVVREYIGAGDTYQVNYTMKLLFEFQGSPEKLYSTLRHNQSVAYGAYIRSSGEHTLSFSPELFFRKKGDVITVRPMKGTARRGRNSAEQAESAHFLHNDIKNRSENVMIVDLLRNDLGRLMHGHGDSRVYVESLFDVESYESLLQMTSTVKAQTAEMTMRQLKLTELFRALFPCGSITGAPKIRTMEIINELEKEERGVYTGAIGYLGPDGSAVFNVPIRTIRLRDNTGEMGIGAGITYDSKPEEEWDESLLKGRFLTHSKPHFQVFETILWQPGSGYWLLDEHLKRLAESADFFKFTCDLDAVRKRLGGAEAGFGEMGKKVRLCLEKDGRIDITSESCEPPTCTALPGKPDLVTGRGLPLVDFSPHQTETQSPWCFHKTTRRDLYNQEFQRARREDLYDVVFCNESGEVTEGCITNVILYDGREYCTPPVSCGLLAGVMRGRLLSEKAVPVVEKTLRKSDFTAAQAIYVCNSVRGVVRVGLRGG